MSSIYRKWNAFLAYVLHKIILRYALRLGPIIDSEIELLIISDSKKKSHHDEIMLFINEIFHLIKKKDKVRYGWVCNEIEFICVSKSLHKKLSYNVYSKTVFLEFPLDNFYSDPEWVIGETAGYFVERAVFRKIFKKSKSLKNSKCQARIAHILFSQRRLFSLKLGPSWEKLYSQQNIEQQRNTPLFDW